MTDRQVAHGDKKLTFDDALAAARDGDKSGFAVLYRDLTPRLLRYAAGLVGQDAEDVVAEAWFQIARDLRRFEGDGNDFRGWSTRIVRNRALDQLRARARRPVAATSSEELVDSAAADDSAAAVEERLSTAAAIELIASLPKDQAEAVLLRVVVGLDAATAGRVVGKSAGAVRVNAHRGLRSLAKRIRNDPRFAP